MFKRSNVRTYWRKEYSPSLKKTIAGVFTLLLALSWSLSPAANLALLSPPDFTFVKGVGGASGADVGYDIATDASGIVIAGAFGNTVDFGGTTLTAAGSPSDAFVAKYDHSNNLLWAKQGKGGASGGSESGNTDARGVTIDASGNVIATGGYVGTGDFDGMILSSGGANEELFLVKYNGSGTLQWVKAATGSFAVKGLAVATDGAGNIFVTGSFGHHNSGGNATFDTTTLNSFGGQDIFVAKYDSSGNLLWVKQAGSSGSDNNEEGRDIAVDSFGNVVVVGGFENTADFSGNMLTAAGDRDIFIAKYDTNGNVLWVKRAGSSGTGNGENGEGVAIDGSDNIVVTGYFESTANFDAIMLTSLGGSDMFTAKYDSSGNALWARSGGGSGFDLGVGLTSDLSGNVYVTGWFAGTANFGGTLLTSSGSDDIFLAKYDTSGNFEWVNRAGSSSGADTGWDVVVGSTSTIYLTGSFTGTSDFDSINKSSLGGTDIYYAIIEPPNQPPMAICQNVTKSANGNCQATVTPQDVNNGSLDPDGDPITLSLSPAGPYSLGTTSVILTVTDDKGASATCTAMVTVVDNTPPTVTANVAQASLWPLNHNLVNVGLTVSQPDNCTTNSTIEVKVYSDEDDNEQTGDGNHSPDAKGLAPGALRLRSERNGNGNGRVYLIVVKAIDGAGNAKFASATVVVPKSQSQADRNAVNAQAASAKAYFQSNGLPPSGYFVVGDGPVIGPKQ